MTSETLVETFEEIMEIEEGFASLYERMLSGTEEKTIKKGLAKIAEDERRHAQNIKMILEILKG